MNGRAEDLIAGRLAKQFGGRRRLIPGRVANLTRQDFLWPGYAAQLSVRGVAATELPGDASGEEASIANAPCVIVSASVKPSRSPTTDGKS